MTLQECREAAVKALPVVHLTMAGCHASRITYARIKQVGVDINDKGIESPFVQLLDVSRNSVCYARPEDVILDTESIESERMRNNV